MNYDQCKLSNAGIPYLSTKQLLQCPYVECPECGSTGKATDANEYHRHNTLMGTSRRRAQYWKQDRDSKVWSLVSDSEVK